MVLTRSGHLGWDATLIKVIVIQQVTVELSWPMFHCVWRHHHVASWLIRSTSYWMARAIVLCSWARHHSHSASV